jgi:hypothetical protein
VKHKQKASSMNFAPKEKGESFAGKELKDKQEGMAQSKVSSLEQQMCTADVAIQRIGWHLTCHRGRDKLPNMASAVILLLFALSIGI